MGAEKRLVPVETRSPCKLSWMVPSAPGLPKRTLPVSSAMPPAPMLAVEEPVVLAATNFSAALFEIDSAWLVKLWPVFY